MLWRARIGHCEPETEVRLIDGRISPPTFVTEEFRERYAQPGMTDGDLFCLVFFDFSRSIKVALLDECPLTPQEVHARGAEVYERARAERTQQSLERGKRRRGMGDYEDYCEELYRNWVSESPTNMGWEQESLWEELRSHRVGANFAPEPYLTFDERGSIDSVSPSIADARVVFLTTNPGKGDPLYQSRPEVRRYGSYQELQGRFASCEDRPSCKEERRSSGKECRLKGGPRSRVVNMIGLCRALRNAFGDRITTEGFVQCECVPFHSEALPGKPELVEYLQGVGAQSALATYLLKLEGFLKGCHVIAIDAATLTHELEGARAPITNELLWHSKWLSYKAQRGIRFAQQG